MNKSTCGLAVLLLGCFVAGLSVFNTRFLGKKVRRGWKGSNGSTCCWAARVAGLSARATLFLGRKVSRDRLIARVSCWAALAAGLPTLDTRLLGEQARLCLQLSFKRHALPERAGEAAPAAVGLDCTAAGVPTLAPASLPAQVVLLGLYNGQRLEDEPEQDIITYSRVDEVRFESDLAPGSVSG